MIYDYINCGPNIRIEYRLRTLILFETLALYKSLFTYLLTFLLIMESHNTRHKFGPFTFITEENVNHY